MKPSLNIIKHMILGALLYVALGSSISYVKAEFIDVPKDVLVDCGNQGGCYLIPMFIIHALLEQNNDLREEIDAVEERFDQCLKGKRSKI